MGQRIRQLAERCQFMFGECRQAEILRNSEWFENFQSDYNLWVSAMKSTAEGKSSLDHRLRYSSDVSEAVCSLMGALSECLAACFELGEFPGTRYRTMDGRAH